jgi:hypothetical protein
VDWLDDEVVVDEVVVLALPPQAASRAAMAEAPRPREAARFSRSRRDSWPELAAWRRCW